jgi:hypothetical protein
VKIIFFFFLLTFSGIIPKKYFFWKNSKKGKYIFLSNKIYFGKRYTFSENYFLLFSSYFFWKNSKKGKYIFLSNKIYFGNYSEKGILFLKIIFFFFLLTFSGKTPKKVSIFFSQLL